MDETNITCAAPFWEKFWHNACVPKPESRHFKNTLHLVHYILLVSNDIIACYADPWRGTLRQQQHSEIKWCVTALISSRTFKKWLIKEVSTFFSSSSSSYRAFRLCRSIFPVPPLDIVHDLETERKEPKASSEFTSSRSAASLHLFWSYYHSTIDGLSIFKAVRGVSISPIIWLHFFTFIFIASELDPKTLHQSCLRMSLVVDCETLAGEKVTVINTRCPCCFL